MTSADLWCTNCRQLVAPKRSFGAGTYILALIVFFAVNPLLVLLVGLQLSGLWWLFASVAAAAAVFLWPGQHDRTPRCPICRSRSLEDSEEEAPTD